MKLRDFRIGWRLLMKEPVYSSAVVLGLAVGFAACFLLLGYVRYSFNYNQQFADARQIYAVKEKRNMLPRAEWRASAPSALRDTALASGMSLQATRAKGYELAARIGEHTMGLTLQVVDANFLDFFGVQAIEGDAGAALARPDALVLDRSTALRLFGPGPALGKLVRIDDVPFEVRAILADQPSNSTVHIDALLGAGVHSWDAPKASDPPDVAWRQAVSLYLKTGPQVDPSLLSRVLQDAVERDGDARWMNASWRAKLGPNGHLREIALAPLADLYFDPDLAASRAGQRYGSKAALGGLAALGVLILLLACTNYVNLAAVRTVARQREIGIRKSLGAGAGQLVRQFVAESLLVTLGASVIGLLLAWVALPLFAELVNRKLGGLFAPAYCAAALALGALLGVLSALYPAWLAWNLPVRATLTGQAGNGGQQLRRSMTVFQFAVAICLVGVTLAVGWQTRFASTADPGFDARPLLVLSMPDKANGAPAFQEQLARLPGIAGVSAISEAVGRDGNTIIGMFNRPDGSTLPLELKQVGPSFFDVYGVAPLSGRLFGAERERPGSTNVILNAVAVKALGYASNEAAVGQMLTATARIIGVAPDLRYRTLRQPSEPMVYQLNPAQAVLTVRVSGDMTAARIAVESLWHRLYPNDMLDVEPAGAIFAQNYSEDLRLAKILATASVVATLLAAFGIYVLAAYSVKRRAREIVLRKLHGASAAAIGRLMVAEFAVLIGIGSALGLPLAWLGMARYLSGFVERAPMGFWPLLAALASVALVALAATGWQTVCAMRIAPVLAFRD
ncbi:MAG: ABC transporter permease [Pseudomonadota bacterium]